LDENEEIEAPMQLEGVVLALNNAIVKQMHHEKSVPNKPVGKLNCSISDGPNSNLLLPPK